MNFGKAEARRDAPRILIISDYIAPVNSIAAIRWTKIGKYLSKDQGYKVDILTNKKKYKGRTTALRPSQAYSYDDTMAVDLTYFDRVIEFDKTMALQGIDLAQDMLAIFRTKLKRNTENEPEAVKEDEWKTEVSQKPRIRMKRAELSLIMGRQYVRSIEKQRIDWADYDVIISSFGPKWPHYVAESIKEAHPEIIWIADYRDAPFDSAETYTQDNVDFAKVHTKLADCILVVSEKEIDNLFIPDGQTVHVIPNGFDPDELESRQRIRSGKFSITYTGTLYNHGNEKSDLTPLFRTLSSLIQDGGILANDVEVVYCGDQGDLFEQQASSYPDVPRRNNRFIPRKEAIALQDRASILVICTWNTTQSQGIITGKVFEYFSSDVPILMLCSGEVPYCELGKMIEMSQTGYGFEEARSDQSQDVLASFLKDRYDEWKETGFSNRTTNWDYVKSFGHDELAAKVHGLIESIYEERNMPDGNR